ncbi:putative COP9 subunit 3 [Aspergillus brunneoviolaceus CBS 621.78]|uniref:COP9 signalosome complex subunit 3 n=1 Tax=Aspergillus brunneoviolaceus CBS 621.78 TaxID=1450534 RepID=A0ACD1FUQ5_9EURO|nr:COP9 signalosome complex subunit 3 [Aspergillus brunneoviolaceus CBS 621.78]RAH40683.1 COP9 signalosome complex subunit 3 [Aspergillus brunneoviolaceus CBS 621.78]
MAESVEQIISLSSHLHSQNRLSETDYVNRVQELVAILRRSSHSLLSEAVLTDLNPHEHTLPYLFVLLHQIDLARSRTRSALPDDIKPGGRLWSPAVQFLREFKGPQVRFVGHEWRQLVNMILDAAEDDSKPVLAVRVLSGAIMRIDQNVCEFTSLHPRFLRLCLLSQSYSYALPVLDKHISSSHTSLEQPARGDNGYMLASKNDANDFIAEAPDISSRLTHKDIVQFYLYGAMIYMALKEWDKALHWLSVVISFPVVNSVSKVMIEAFKKWVLVGLLRHGKLVTAPKIISSHVMKIYQAVARPYLSLADAFEKSDEQRLRTEADLGKSVWCADLNSGLVRQLLQAYDMFLVLKLCRVFSALTTRDIAAKAASAGLVSSAKIENLIAFLVMSGVLGARLLQRPCDLSLSMLRFPKSIQPYCSRSRTRVGLMRKSHALELLSHNCRECNNELKIGRENIDVLVRCQGWSGVTGKGGGKGSIDHAAFGVDEDIMGDLS